VNHSMLDVSTETGPERPQPDITHSDSG
jgi:hypothetical protein